MTAALDRLLDLAQRGGTRRDYAAWLREARS